MFLWILGGGRMEQEANTGCVVGNMVAAGVRPTSHLKMETLAGSETSFVLNSRRGRNTGNALSLIRMFYKPTAHDTSSSGFTMISATRGEGFACLLSTPIPKCLHLNTWYAGKRAQHSIEI
jgi:hypothetical protein